MSSSSSSIKSNQEALTPLIEETELESPLKKSKNNINVGGLSLSKGDRTPLSQHLSRSVSASDIQKSPKLKNSMCKQLHMKIT